MQRVDVAIIGAGAAGLAAGREAAARGLTFVVFEALDRIGGRAWTESTTFGVPWDWGCHWLHSASVNVMRELADDYGFRYRNSRPVWRSFGPAGIHSPEETAALEASEARCYAAFLGAGNEGRDVSATDVVDRSEPGYELFRTSIAAEWSVDPDCVSAVDAAGYRDTDENWPVIDGYGALVAHHGRSVPVELSTPIHQIAWGTSPVKVHSAKGLLEADSVVLTVSTNVLAGDVIAFDPPLPDWKREAAAAVPLGIANKATFSLNTRTLGIEEHSNAVVPFAAGGMVFLQLKPIGHELVNFYLAGPIAAELERRGSEATYAACIDTLRSVFGSAAANEIGTWGHSAWGAIETIGGAYASAKPGYAQKRRKLALPVEERLYFAGEATHPEFYSSCHGAHLSGIAAIEEVVRQRSGQAKTPVEAPERH